MKAAQTTVLTGLALFAVAGAQADPFERETVPADAKWVLHVDLDLFRTSKIGRGLMEEVVMEHARKVKQKAKLDLPAILENTHSMTIYGTDYDSGNNGKGVLLWRGEPEIEQIANAFLIQQTEATKAGEGNVRRIQETPFPIYTIENEVHAAVISGKGLILGRSRNQLQQAVKVLEGDARSLATSQSFTDYPTLPEHFFLMAYAESLGESADIPPQAEVLKLTDGGRIAIGEMDDKILIQLILRARSEEVTVQIQQVIQGLLALATLSLGEETELQKIIRATKVNTNGRQVKLDLSVPMEEAIKQIERTKNEPDDEDGTD